MSDAGKVADAEFEKLQEIAEKIGEDFDTVQILVTRHEPAELNGTLNIAAGVGNWFARIKHAEIWVEREIGTAITERPANEDEEDE